jgi:hypothetical protein
VTADREQAVVLITGIQAAAETVEAILARAWTEASLP